MEGKCPYCGRYNEEESDGYFRCKNCYKWYLPLDVYNKRKEIEKKRQKTFLDYEENNG